MASKRVQPEETMLDHLPVGCRRAQKAVKGECVGGQKLRQGTLWLFKLDFIELKQKSGERDAS